MLDVRDGERQWNPRKGSTQDPEDWLNLWDCDWTLCYSGRGLDEPYQLDQGTKIDVLQGAKEMTTNLTLGP